MKCSSSDQLLHYGIRGQQWGVRRFQNDDGTLTEEGRQRYLKNLSPEEKRAYDRLSDENKRFIDKRIAKGKSFETAFKEGARNEVDQLGKNKALNGVMHFLAGVGAKRLSSIASHAGHPYLSAFLRGFGLAERVGGAYTVGSSIIKSASAKKQIKQMSLKELLKTPRTEEQPKQLGKRTKLEEIRDLSVKDEKPKHLGRRTKLEELVYSSRR